MLSLLVSSGAQAQQADPVNVMQQCQSFDQCTIVWGGCSDVAINKAYMQQFKQATVCEQTKQHDAGAVPTCEDNKCVVATMPSKGGGQ